MNTYPTRRRREDRNPGATTHQESRLIQIALVLLIPLILIPRFAGAQISTTSGAATVVDQSTVMAVGSVEDGAFTSDTKIRVFVERMNVQLAASMDLDITVDGKYRTPLTPGVVGSGDWVTSVMIHVDRASATGSSYLAGSIEFDSDILGLVVEDGTLNDWDPVIKLPGVGYPTGELYRGLELGSGWANPDSLLISGNVLKMYITASSPQDQMRVILAGEAPGVSFSFDRQSQPSRNSPASFGGTGLYEGDVLTPGAGGAPGPNPPVPGPTVAPGIMLTAAALGISHSGAGGTYEVDALSFGHDRGRRLRFSVDEFAAGDMPRTAPDVRSEGSIGLSEAAADVFRYRGPVTMTGPSFRPANRAALDGDGLAAMGRDCFGLIEPDTCTLGVVPDPGDNLDALDLGTVSSDLAGPVYFSLDDDFLDWAEGVLNYGTAPANGFSGADILMTIPGSGVITVYASAAALGLNCGGECQDDIDALLLVEDGEPGYDPASDHILFSLRRGSGSLGLPTAPAGLQLTEADILAPGPVIVIPGESLGLNTTRSSWVPPCQTPDDVDALDLVPPHGAPVTNPDEVSILPGSTVSIDVLANDRATVGALDPSDVVIFEPPQLGFIDYIDPASGRIVYVHNGVAQGEDSLRYVAYNNLGEVSEPATVYITIADAAAVDAPAAGPASLVLAGPNPFSSGTAFLVAPREAGMVKVTVYDVAGRRVRMLLDAEMKAGDSRVLQWDGRNENGGLVTAGMYFVRMRSPAGETSVSVLRLN